MIHRLTRVGSIGNVLKTGAIPVGGPAKAPDGGHAPAAQLDGDPESMGVRGAW